MNTTRKMKVVCRGWVRDWAREKNVTASQLNRVTILLEKLGGAEKVEKLLDTLAEEKQKPVKGVRFKPT